MTNSDSPATALPVIAIALLVACAGCQTERVRTSDGRPMPPEPRPARPAPEGLAARHMYLQPFPPIDGDGNGYPDIIPIETRLWADLRFASLEADGVFVFTLFRRGEARRPGARPIAEWRLTGETIEAGRAQSALGVRYLFRLNLLESTTDRLPPTQADLRGRFEPANGAPVVRTRDEVRPVQIGRRPSKY